jgi:hypothetical protein
MSATKEKTIHTFSHRHLRIYFNGTMQFPAIMPPKIAKNTPMRVFTIHLSYSLWQPSIRATVRPGATSRPILFVTGLYVNIYVNNLSSRMKYPADVLLKTFRVMYV